MPNEKLMILKMLEDGKITPDEAAKLLEASGKVQQSEPSEPYDISPRKRTIHNSKPNYNNSQFNKPINNTSQTNMTQNQQPYSTSSQQPYSTYPPQGNGRYEKNNSYSGFENFAEDMGRKFDTLVKDLEPTFKNFAGRVAEKTNMAADRVSKSFQPSNPPRPPEHPKNMMAGYGRSAERTFELKVAPGHNELNISGLNAPVFIKGYNGDNISAKVLCVPKIPNARIELVVLGGKYFLDYDEDEFQKVSIDAFIPERLFNNISLSTMNSDLNISTIQSGFVNMYSTNGNVNLNDICADNIKIECENGKKMILNGIFAENAQIENFNGSIESYNVDVANLQMTAYNGPLTMNVSGFNNFDNYTWSVETNNHKLNVNLPAAYDVGYHIKAQTSLGSLRVALTGLNYLYNDKSNIEAKSINYDELSKKVRLILGTSNAPLTIN